MRIITAWIKLFLLRIAKFAEHFIIFRLNICPIKGKGTNVFSRHEPNVKKVEIKDEC